MRAESLAVRSHVERRLLEQGRRVAESRRLYLDKCFWVRMRDEVMGLPRSPLGKTLLEELRTQVRNRALICPISDVLFVELLGQSDRKTRRATAELIDELSCGVALVPEQARFELEAVALVLSKLGHRPPRVEHRVWSRLAFVFGILHPSPHPSLDAVTAQIGFFNYLWELPLARVIDVVGDRSPPETFFAEQAVALNDWNAEHTHELRSFTQAYRVELAGALELAVPIVLNTLATVQPKEEADLYQKMPTTAEAAHAFLIEAAQTTDGRRKLRTAHIAASLHAATRWNKAKKLTPHDLPDLLHAQAAIAYCDGFFTDGPTRHLVDQKNLHLSEDFGCFTASADESALAWLRSSRRTV